jgi:hypothetical protein
LARLRLAGGYASIESAGRQRLVSTAWSEQSPYHCSVLSIVREGTATAVKRHSFYFTIVVSYPSGLRPHRPHILETAGRTCERQATRVYLALRSAKRLKSEDTAKETSMKTAVLLGSVLVHADDRGIDHLHRRVTTGGQCIHDPVPDASPPPPNEAIVTSGAGTVVLRQVAPWRTGTQDLKDAIEHATVIYAPNAARLVRQHRFDGGPFVIAEFVAHDSRLRFRSLNHVSGRAINRQRPVGVPLMF